MYVASSESRNSTAPTCSSTSAMRPIGVTAIMPASTPGALTMPRTRGEYVVEGAVALTVIPYCATSRARWRVMPSSPALLAA